MLVVKPYFGFSFVVFLFCKMLIKQSKTYLYDGL